MNTYKNLVEKLLIQSNDSLDVLIKGLKKKNVEESIEEFKFLYTDLTLDEEWKADFIKKFNNSLMLKVKKDATSVDAIFNFWAEYPPTEKFLLPLIGISHTSQKSKALIEQLVSKSVLKTNSIKLTKMYYAGETDFDKITACAILAKKESNVVRKRDLAPMLEDIMVLPTNAKIDFFKNCGLTMSDLLEHALQMGVRTDSFAKIFKSIYDNFDLSGLSDIEKFSFEQLMIKTMSCDKKIKLLDGVFVYHENYVKLETITVEYCGYEGKRKLNDAQKMMYCYLLKEMGMPNSLDIIEVFTTQLNIKAINKKNMSKNLKAIAEDIEILVEKRNLDTLLLTAKASQKFKL